MREHPMERRFNLKPRDLARLVLGLIVVLLFALFMVENSRTVPVQFLFWQGRTHLAWALVLAGVLGLLIGLALPRFWHRR